MGTNGQTPSATDEKYPVVERHPSVYRPFRKFHLSGESQKHYQQQYGDIYFFRLAKLKPAVEEIAQNAWADFDVAGEQAQRKARVLDVRQGELCWVAGTIYMDMPLKPNVLEDIAMDKGVAVPPPREKYLSPSGQDQIMLEDESGRLHLVGAILQDAMLVTGCIIAVVGTENAGGEFEVLDLKVPDLPLQPQRWDGDDGSAMAVNGNGESAVSSGTNAFKATTGGKVALVSGLGISGDESDSLALTLLEEYLLGETSDPEDQKNPARISRLIIAGSSLAQPPPPNEEATGKKQKKYGYDASAYNPAPITHLDRLLSALLPSIPVTLMPGESDPANVSLPQQPLHTALFSQSKAYASHPQSKDAGWFDTTTNPWEGNIDGWRFMGSAGQPINDIFKYVDGDDRLHMMESVLRWRVQAPTAPDTLWCYPYQDEEPFVVEETPHVFFAGNQPDFRTTIISGPTGQEVRLIAIPSFKETGHVILVSTDTLDVELLKFKVFDDI